MSWLALAAAASVGSTALVESATISGVAVSPDGRKVAYRIERASVATNARRSAWRIAALDGREPPATVIDGGEPELTDSGTTAPSKAVWVGDGRSIIVAARRNGALQLWRAGRGASETRLTQETADILDFALDPSGRALHYKVGATRDAVAAAERQAYDEGVVIDQTVDLVQSIAGGTIVNGERRMQRLTGTWFDRAPLLWDSPRSEFVLDVETMAARPARRGARDADLDWSRADGVPRSRNARGDSVALALDDALHPPIVVRQAGEQVRCTAPVCRSGLTRGAFWAWGGTEVLILSRTRDRRTRIDRWIPGQATTMPAGVVETYLDECVAVPAALVCVASAATRPPSLVRVGLQTGGVTPLDDPNAELSKAIAHRARALSWSAGRTTFDGILLAPAAPGPVPLVVSYYVCNGFLRGLAGDEVPVAALVEAGIAVLCIDFPRVAGKRTDAQDYALARSGIAAILQQLAREGVVDPRRVGMHGFSFGSQIAIRLAVDTDWLAAVALSSAQIEATYYWFNAHPARDFQAVLRDYFGLGPIDTDSAGWQRMSIARNIAWLKTPLMMQLPEQEARLNPELFARAWQTKRPAIFYAFADAAHLKSQPRQKRAAFERTYDWFRYWLSEVRDPEPRKADQYRLWDALRAMPR